MRPGPILAALLRHKVAAGLIAAQIALTLAIIANALYIVVDRTTLMNRPSGVVEADLFTIAVSPDGPIPDRQASMLADLDVVRAVPGVAGAYLTNSMPVSGSGWSTGIDLPGETSRSPERGSAMYFADETTLATLGLTLAEGRNFEPGEISWMDPGTRADPDSVIITRALGKRLFGDESPIGKLVGISGEEGATRQRVVGVVERLVSPWPGWGQFDNAVLVPMRDSTGAFIAVRAEPGRRDETMKAVEEALWKRSTARVVDSLASFEAERDEQYREDRALVVIMIAITLSLLAVTALGIVGQASFWVTQRTRQIGVRRALGATRGQIVRYFQAENAIIAGIGIGVGSLLAYAVNYALAVQLGAERLPWFYLPLGAVVVLLLGQLAVYAPARRAAGVPPAVATRSA
jgi:putative ABC transport system permease protein